MIRLFTALCFAASSLWAPLATAQTQEHVASIGRFAFEQGGSLPDMKVGYVTWGTLSKERDNVVLMLPPTSGTRHSYDALIGPGKAVDTDRYLVVVVDPIGGGTSSKPGDGLETHFPRYTIRDMVAAQHRLIATNLRIPQLRAVIGASMGSFQALEWAVTYPSMVERLLLVAPAARSDAHLGTIVDAMAATLQCAPVPGRKSDTTQSSAIVHAAAAQFMPWLRSDAYLARRGLQADREEAAALGDQWTANWDPVSLIWRYRASAGHDVAVPFKGDQRAALARITAASSIVVISSDRTIPAYLTKELIDGIQRATVTTIKTDAGHGTFGAAPGTPDYKALAEAVKRLVEEPVSTTSSAMKPHLTSSVRHNDTVILSGQLAFDKDGAIHGDVSAQTETILRNISGILASHGLSLDDVGKTTVWLANREDFVQFNRTYATIFGTHRPARSTVVAGMTTANALLEIEVTAWPGGER